MKMAKASEKDIDAAGDAMSVLNDISSGYYPKREGDECEDTFFDPDEPEHLRKFYDLMSATLDVSPGWPGRVIGGMCYVVLYDKNRIVDPDADVLELHPRFKQAEAQRDELLDTLRLIAAECTTEELNADELAALIQGLCREAIAKHQPAGEGPATPT